MYEYESRARLWRVLRLFEERDQPLSALGVALALERYLDAAAAFQQLGHEIACHGLRWISYQNFDEVTERAHPQEAAGILPDLTVNLPAGWYADRYSANSRRLIVKHGGFLCEADSYADYLPYSKSVDIHDELEGIRSISHLVVRYTLNTKDMCFTASQGFNSYHQFFRYFVDALYADGDPQGLNRTKMLFIGLHCRIVGRAARMAALARFLDHIQSHDHVGLRVA